MMRILAIISSVLILLGEGTAVDAECSADGVSALASSTTRYLEVCNILEFTTCEDFKANFWDKNMPGVFRFSKQHDSRTEKFRRFQMMTTKEALMQSNLSIKLSTSVSYTGRIYKDVKVSEYLKDTTPASRLGNETFYLFGNHEGEEWQMFLDGYPKLETSPLFACLFLDPADSALSFGCAKEGTGVPWHFHGAGFLEVLVGSKMWFLTPYEVPNEVIRFDPNVTTRAWFEDEYLGDAALRSLIKTCTLQEGDIIFFPPMWRHATYNVDWSSWISTFLK